MAIFLVRLLATLSLILLSIGNALAASELINSTSTHHEAATAEQLTLLAARYEHAEGVELDYSKAVSLYCSASRMGYANAQYALGWMYAHGRGIDRNDRVAAHFFNLAATQGHEQASAMLRYVALDKTLAQPACLQPAVVPAVESTLMEVVYPKGQIADLVHQLAPLYGVDPKLALAIISVESSFNPRAISPKNAQGLMQLTPDTARRFHVKNSFDPEQNIKGGLSYLQWLLVFFKGNVPLVAAAYNAGERAVENHRGIPPYMETLNYVRKITSLYRKAHHPFKGGESTKTHEPSKIDESSATPITPIK